MFVMLEAVRFAMGILIAKILPKSMIENVGFGIGRKERVHEIGLQICRKRRQGVLTRMRRNDYTI